jgi:MFS family permease
VLGFLKIPLGIGTVFVLYFSLNASILYCLDIFIEHYSTEENTGNIRGVYLAAVNSAWVISPLIAGVLISRFGYDIVYMIAAILFVPAGIAVYTSQKKFHDALYEKESFIHAIRLAFKNPPVRRILFLSFLLHFFFVWMVIYLPILLTKTMGIPWNKTGILFTAMLLPFIIFQYPAGVLADKRLGEKELLIFGFLVAGIATLVFAIHRVSFSFIQIAIVLFLTRVGASIIEIMCDTYFFKQITEKDSTLVSLYRSMMPFSYVIGPVLGSLYLLGGGSITGIFVILGVMMLTAVPYTLLLKDTK